MPDSFNEGIDVADVFALRAGRADFGGLLLIILCGFGVRRSQSVLVGLLVILIEVILGIVANNGVQTVATFAGGIEQVLGK